jgi:hypothetical protein
VEGVVWVCGWEKRSGRVQLVVARWVGLVLLGGGAGHRQQSAALGWLWRMLLLLLLLWLLGRFVLLLQDVELLVVVCARATETKL